MKTIILFTIVLAFSLSLSAVEESKKKAEDSGVVKVRIIEESSSFSEEDEKKIASPKVDIKIVENQSSDLATVGDSELASSGTMLSQPVAVAELTPTNPDKNLVIYFILLMVIIVGIMVLATLIPAPRSRNNQ